MWNLGEEAGPITGAVGGHGSPMVEIDQTPHGVAQQPVAGSARPIRDESDTAGIPLLVRVI